MSAVVLSLYFAVALNCCVAPIPMFALGGVSETDVRVLVGGLPVTFDRDPWHPVLTIVTESERKKATIATNNQQRMTRMDS